MIVAYSLRHIVYKPVVLLNREERTVMLQIKEETVCVWTVSMEGGKGVKRKHKLALICCGRK